MSSAEYAALPTDESYPPQESTRPPPKPVSRSPFSLHRILIVAVVALGAIVFWKFDYGSSIKEAATTTPKTSEELTNPNMYGGRPRTGKLNVG